MFVFVYGSLKKGFPNHRLLKGAEYICSTHTREHYAMLDLHEFPGVVRDLNISPISGEVYDLESITIEQLDIFEGSWYSRDSVELEAGFSAQMYFLRQIPADPEYSRIVEIGIWS